MEGWKFDSSKFLQLVLDNFSPYHLTILFGGNMKLRTDSNDEGKMGECENEYRNV